MPSTLPGFATLSRLPGFSFFRAPARWSAAAGLALSLLAGFGLNGWRSWPRPGRMLARFAVLAALGPAVVVCGVELALASTERPGWPAVGFCGVAGVAVGFVGFVGFVGDTVGDCAESLRVVSGC